VYHEALAIELECRRIPFQVGVHLPIEYKGRVLAKDYIADLIVAEKIIVELKALDCLSGLEEAQVLNYLKASHLRLGLLINFGHPGRLEWRRLIR
jgi:GxxExxY protein